MSSLAELMEETAQHRRELAGYRQEIEVLQGLADDAEEEAERAERLFAERSCVESDEVRRLLRSAA